MTRFLQSRRVSRVIVGCLASPLSVAAVVFLCVLNFVTDSFFMSPELISVIMAILSYAVTLVVVTPCHVALTIRQRTALLEYVLTGFGIGIVAQLTLLIMVFGVGDLIQGGPGETIALIGFGGLLGALNAGVFWRLTRPDRRMEGES